MSYTVRTTKPAEPARANARTVLAWARRVLAWTAVVTTIVYAAWVLAVASDTVLGIAGITPGRERALPPLFALHAVAGAVCLASGSSQLRLLAVTLRSRRWLHRLLGRTYLCASWTTSVAGLAVTSGFEVGVPAKLAFTLEAVLWFCASTVAYAHVRRHDYRRHSQWMIRSYALALFFLTFSFLQPAFAATHASRTTVYTAAILTSVAINLVAAESWIRRHRSHAS